jgi:hypothetical protein
METCEAFVGIEALWVAAPVGTAVELEDVPISSGGIVTANADEQAITVRARLLSR